MKKLFVLALLALPLAMMAQKKPATSQTIDLGFSIGNEFAVSASYFHNWKLWKKKKFEVGVGGRFSAFFGKDLYYTTAPARLTSGRTGPLVFFTEDIEANIDTLLLQKPNTNSVNLAVELGYNISSKLFVAFNIDVIGFTFGKKFNDGLYIRNNNGTTGISGKVAPFNILLISDNDRGSLSSELYLRYKFNKRWGIHGGVSFDFSEYKTDSEVQQSPSPNDRFRYKSAGALVGVTWLLKD
jgi:hypothetical protein